MALPLQILYPRDPQPWANGSLEYTLLFSSSSKAERLCKFPRLPIFATECTSGHRNHSVVQLKCSFLPGLMNLEK